MTDPLYSQYEAFVVGKDHPCLMAQSAFKNGEVELHAFEQLGTRETARRLLYRVQDFVESYDFESNNFRTLMAVFPSERIETEERFEHLLWEQLRHLHALDGRRSDETVDRDPASNKFGFSLAGTAFFIVGMHPQSSRRARRSPHPCMVFNLHWQFERLRENGVFETVRDKIRHRDRALQGESNPMLEDHGRASEARQYSGRAVEDDWVCPIHPLLRRS